MEPDRAATRGAPTSRSRTPDVAADALRPVLAALPGDRGRRRGHEPAAPRPGHGRARRFRRPGRGVPELAEWDYGVYEGRRTADIRGTIPGWSVWTHPIDGGEEPGRRAADRVIARDASTRLTVPALLFRPRPHAADPRRTVVRARPAAGRALTIDPASLSILGHGRSRHEYRVSFLSFVSSPPEPGYHLPG